MRLSELGELGLLAELERRGLAREIENDAAQLSGGRVVTNDVLVQEVHFRSEWTSYRDLGYRAAAVNLSDLAASGRARGPDRRPRRATETPLEDVIELYEPNEPGVPVLAATRPPRAALPSR
jgi:thiamine-monophosphate kinase